jgi:hypothetical protein
MEIEDENFDDPLLKVALFEAMKVQLLIHKESNFLKANEENQNFSSKRKKELDQFFKKPFFIETIIRIKLPDRTMWEAKFTPKETLKTVYDLFLKVFL